MEKRRQATHDIIRQHTRRRRTTQECMRRRCRGALLQARHNGACPSCRAAVRAAQRPPAAAQDAAARAAALPSLDAVYSRRVSTRKYVPAKARAAWADCLATSLSAAVWHNDVLAWAELAMLPKAVLCAPPRGGKALRKQAAAFTRLRCERWMAGERASLGADIPERARAARFTKPATDEDARRQRQERAA